MLRVYGVRAFDLQVRGLEGCRLQACGVRALDLSMHLRMCYQPFVNKADCGFRVRYRVRGFVGNGVWAGVVLRVLMPFTRSGFQKLQSSGFLCRVYTNLESRALSWDPLLVSGFRVQAECSLGYRV